MELFPARVFDQRNGACPARLQPRKRSAENLKNGIEDATFGTVYRWLNGDEKK